MTSSSAAPLASIPHRPYGRQEIEPVTTAAIVGLGCSSFSGFFLSSDSIPTWISQTKTTHVATIVGDDPLVLGWVATIHYAVLEAGITLLDTAPWYGHGVSEQVLGLALSKLWDCGKLARSRVILNTKVGRYEAEPAMQFDFSQQATLVSVDRSLQRLRTNYIDVLQLHDPEFAPHLPVLLQETIPAMLTCQQQGKCRALGLTGYPLTVQRQVFQATLEQYGKNIWDQALTYGHYNLHDQTLLRQPGTLDYDPLSFFEFCRQHNCVCLAAAPLSMGLLSNNTLPEWHPASPALRAACREAVKICRDHGVSIVELSLLFAVAEPRIPVTILGMKDIEQVQTVQRVCQRFQAANFQFEAALSESEVAAWKVLSDANEGPFAQLWKSQDYHWDGIVQAREFWKSVPEKEVQEWQASSM